MTTFVLLHGGGGGSWMWTYTAAALRQLGHHVHTVTFTGSGERRHLVSPDSTIQTHVTDVRVEMELNDIDDALLVAHSYAGAVAPGVAAVAGSRLRGIVYLDGLILHRGESVAQAMGFMSGEQVESARAALIAGSSALTAPTADRMRAETAVKPFRMSPQRQQWLLRHLSDMPTAATVVPADVGAESIGQPVDYVAASDTFMKPKIHERARALGWRMREIEGDHLFAIGEAETTAKILDAIAREPVTTA
jgi:pimeloyl-ACP methyl ester carboxylesterase